MLLRADASDARRAAAGSATPHQDLLPPRHRLRMDPRWNTGRIGRLVQSNRNSPETCMHSIFYLIGVVVVVLAVLNLVA